MLSGDRRDSALLAARELAIAPERVHAPATPAGKVERVASLGCGTMMVGDGLNDAAALSSAAVGVALASATHVAVDAAEVIIRSDRLGALTELIVLARATLRTIRQNLFFAFFYNALAIPAAAFGLLGTHGPLIAAACMGLSDLTVLGNALRLRRAVSQDQGTDALASSSPHIKGK